MLTKVGYTLPITKMFPCTAEKAKFTHTNSIGSHIYIHLKYVALQKEGYVS